MDFRPYSADELASLAPEQHAELQHVLTYGPGLESGAYANGETLAVGRFDPEIHFESHPVADLASQWALATPHTDQACYRTWSSLCGVESGFKGKNDQVVHIPGVMFDLDTIDGFHAPAKSGLPDPTREQARQVLDRFREHGIEFSYGIDSGGGYQAAVVFDGPIDSPRNDKGQVLTPPVLIKAVKALKLVSGDLGVSCDTKVTKNPSSLVRIAGTVNAKIKPTTLTDKMIREGWTQERLNAIPDDIATRPVRLTQAKAETMSVAGVVAAFDAVIEKYTPEAKAKAPKASAKKKASSRAAYKHACGATGDPRDQVCLALPMSRIVRELDRFAGLNPMDASSLDDEEGSDAKLAWDDNPQNTCSAELIWSEHPESGVVRAAAVPYGNSTSDLLGTDESKPQCTYWYAVRAHLSDEFGLAEALFHKHAGDPDGLFDALSASETAEQVREAFPDLEEDYRGSQGDSIPDRSLGERFEAALARFDGSRVTVCKVGKKSTVVFLGGPDHGTWLAEKEYDEDRKKWVEAKWQIWDAVAYRTGAASYSDGDIPEGEQLSYPIIIDRYGKKWGAERGKLPLPHSAATDAKAVYKSCKPIGVSAPATSNSGHISTCLTSLTVGGANTAYQTAMGWHRDPETAEWRYNGTTAGVGSKGVVPGIWRRAPEIERGAGGAVLVHEQRASTCQAAVGWPVVPDNPEQVAVAATVIPALRALTPTRLDIHLVMLGAYFAAPLLGLAEKPAVNVKGEPETGKSKMTSCYNTLLTDLPIGARYLTASLSVKFSVPGIDGLRRSYNDAVVVLDDAAENNDIRKNADMRAAVDGAIKAAFGAADGPMADGDGGTKVRRASRCAVIVTSEKPLEGMGIESRALSVDMAKGELAPDVDSDFGGFVEQGLPRQLYGAFAKWLAAALDDQGPDALRKRVYAHKNHLYKALSLGKVRAVDVVGSVYAGLMMLGEFLSESGCRDALASEAEIATTMRDLADAGQERNKAAALGRVAVDLITGMLGGRKGHLEGVAHLDNPDLPRYPDASVAVACGWEKDDEDGWKTPPSSQHLGHISEPDAGGNRYVLITDQGLMDAWRSAHRAESHTQVRDSWRSSLTVEGRRKVERPALPGTKIRKKGALFTSDVFGIGGDRPAAPPGPPPPPAPPEPTKPTAPNTPQDSSDDDEAWWSAKLNEEPPPPEPWEEVAHPPKARSGRAKALSPAAPEPREPSESMKKLVREVVGETKPMRNGEYRPLAKRQIEAVARKIPRGPSVWPDDLIKIDLG